MIPRIAGRPVNLIALDGERTGNFVVTIQWSRQSDRWETVSTDHNVAFDSWESPAAWLELRADTMDAVVEDMDMPAPIQEMVRRAEGDKPSQGVPPWSACDLATSIRTELVDKPHLDRRLAETRDAFMERVRQRQAEAQRAETERIAREAAKAQAEAEATAAEQSDPTINQVPAKG